MMRKFIINKYFSIPVLLTLGLLTGCMTPEKQQANVHTLATSGNLPAAEAAAAQITDSYGRVASYCEIAKAKAKNGDVAGAKADINRAISLVGTIPVPSFHRFDTDYSEGVEYWRTDTDIFKTPELKEAWNNCVKANTMLQAGDQAEMKRLLQTAFSTAKYSQNEYRDRIYQVVAEIQLRACDFPAARETIRQTIADNLWSVRFFGPLQARCGDLIEAKTNIRKEMDHASLPMAIFDKKLEPSFRSSAFQDIAENQILIGDFEGAEESLQQATAAANRSNQRDYDLGDIAKLNYLLASWRAHPEWVIAGSKDLRFQAQKCVSSARGELAKAQAKAGDFASARATAALVIDETEKKTVEGEMDSMASSFENGNGDVKVNFAALLSIPSAREATPERVRQQTETWIKLKNQRLSGALNSMTLAQKQELLGQLEQGILDCTTQSNLARNQGVIAAQTKAGDPLVWGELSDNYLNLQNIIKSAYKNVKVSLAPAEE
jgi:hypothetical protein